MARHLRRPSNLAASKRRASKGSLADKVANINLSRKRHMNIVFIGHVDAGKSTIAGHILAITGTIDSRTLEKCEEDAKERGRESWKYAYALDTTEGERAKGKTEECGHAYFETNTTRYTILDAPGHKGYVPHMIDVDTYYFGKKG
eukprot:CAMPEP_0167808796 /NCGR_PEP_ID=MMETSP0111_2-20121227/23407_1 /TAXON_ID=91324 /ORGANISM="Lotharella globosa, Strain CCCM811" /LENGTH=144 /DNA_ID=CAMNT_0007707049 /DNA_START=58 /DNA_END=491 /DNA_ORIENTATION=-